MRRVRYSVAMSLDGYIAGPNGEADWIVMDPDLGQGFADFFTQFDTLLVGRKTFEVIARPSGSAGGGFSGFRIIVVSRTLDPKRHPNVTVVAGDLVATVTALKQAEGKDIWLFGGGDLFRSLLDVDLVDTVEVGIIPVLLGQGIPLLPSPATQTALTLTAHRIYPKTGTLMLKYAVTRARARRRGVRQR
jgi:dihydrofolate reductase